MKILLTLSFLFAATNARAATTTTIGIFMPTSIGDGQARFDFGEKMAAALTKSLGSEVTARNFARYSDFLTALNGKKLDIVVVDSWIAAQMSDRVKPIAVAVMNGETRQRWLILGRDRDRHTIAELNGKDLAVTRGTSQDIQFVSNVVFEGYLAVEKHFKLVSVPAVESGLRMFGIASVDAVLIPASLVPPKAKVIYKSSPIPIATVAAINPKAEFVTAITGLGPIGPFEKFVAGDVGEIANLRRLMSKGPPPRIPALASVPSLRLDVRSLVTFKGVEAVLPVFLDYLPVTKELPDD